MERIKVIVGQVTSEGKHGETTRMRTNSGIFSVTKGAGKWPVGSADRGRWATINPREPVIGEDDRGDETAGTKAWPFQPASPEPTPHNRELGGGTLLGVDEMGGVGAEGGGGGKRGYQTRG